jgi:hypothetical protein
MFRGFGKSIGLFLFLLFISGSFLVPVFHKAHCDDHPATDSDTHCPICQVANTPCLTPVSLPAIEPAETVMGTVQFPLPVFVFSPLQFPTQARAPPAG